MDNQIQPEYFQVHYYLRNDSHAMNAAIFSEASLQITKIVGELNKLLGVQFEVQIEALEEGGIKTWFKLNDLHLSKKQKKKLAKKVKQLKPHIATIIVGVMIVVGSETLTTDQQKETEEQLIRQLQIDDLERERLIDSLTVEKLKKDIETEDRDQLFLFEVERVIQILNQQGSIKATRSKFYDLIDKEGKVDQISGQAFNKDYHAVSKEVFVPKARFQEFIIPEEELGEEIQEQIEIMVRTAVLDKSNLSWYGVVNEEQITFKLKDYDFHQKIARARLKFEAGTILIGDLITDKKINKKNQIQVKSRLVTNVTQIIYPDGEVVDIIYEGS